MKVNKFVTKSKRLSSLPASERARGAADKYFAAKRAALPQEYLDRLDELIRQEEIVRQGVM